MHLHHEDSCSARTAVVATTESFARETKMRSRLTARTCHLRRLKHLCVRTDDVKKHVDTVVEGVWGIQSLDLDPAIAACQGDSTSYTNTVAAAGFDPFLIGQVAALRLLAHYQDDG